jgi:thiosulfate/3-mercaptopyruvate sulfurtransferase
MRDPAPSWGPVPPDARVLSGEGRVICQTAVVSALITAGELADALESAHPPVVLDVRWSLAGPPGRERYDAGHIPGAGFVDLDKDLSAPPRQDRRGGRHPLPDPATFGEAMRRLGVSASRPVVVYGDRDGWGAARAWWCLRYFGHPDVRFLDGGYDAWTGAGLPIETAEPATTPGDFQPRPGGMPVLDAAAAARLAEHGVLLDARAAARYRGDEEPIDPVAGHIPGAVNAPTTDNLDASGRFLPAERLRRRFAELGVDGSAPVGVYCGSGVSAAHEVLTLDVLGLPAALYVGSWSDWVSDPSRPVATGAEPGDSASPSPSEGPVTA